MKATKFVRFCEWYSRQPSGVQALVVVSGAGVGVAAGIIAAPVVGGLVSAAGFGVAGGTLSGAAASSAGLAALGGGSVASGGLGMLGGTCATASASGGMAALATSTFSKKVRRNGKKTNLAYRRARKKRTRRELYKFE